MRRRLGDLPRPIRVGLYGVATAILLFMCLAPTRDLPGAGLFWDKWEHVAAWFVLTTTGFILAPRRPRAIVIFAIALGAGIEVLQATLTVFGRDGDILDLLADSVGVVTAMVIALIARHVRLQ
jgi:VanZ family protein